MMNSSQYLRNPSEYVLLVKTYLETSLAVGLISSYKPVSTAVEGIEFSYRVGFSKITDKVNNDGRETHEVELIFSVVANTSSELFDLDALDATSRVEREFQNQLFGLGDTLERPHYIVNEPQIIDQEHGYFIRTVTIRQYVKIGNPEQETFELVEGGLNVS